MADTTDRDRTRRELVSSARANNLQELLDKAGYLKLGHVTVSASASRLNVEDVLVSLLVDYLHFSRLQGRLFQLSELQDLAQTAYALYEKELT